ncbi:uncharacterized protein LOC124292951 [Neodiprion lecontei]|uniref:Uncharacterized protein LOC124292951 n=1 Tax=Neodiprion lecontei TaxID=441921 RepID=A0ABM3FID0_NEOLC|nr:uncharacterized protein LOC124292951 [Neodiprion lecontei]
MFQINADFRLMHPNVKVTNFSADVILQVYEKYSAKANNNTKSFDDEEPDWDKMTTAHITLLKLLPPTAKGRKKSERDGVVSAIDRLILFHKTGTPLDNAPIKTAQPCLLAVGPNKAAISSYFIAVEKKVLPIDATDSSAAFDTLFKCHFVFNTNFDTNLSMYYNFLQEFYYKMESNVRFTARMREVRAWLTQI